MAVEPEFVKKRKRKKSCGVQGKLLNGERVEVRSEEDGFLGSWYAGTVIASSSGCRHVKYDHLLTDNGDDNLVAIVSVSSFMDGTNFTDASQCHSRGRGHIRPLPPSVKFGEWSLPYGLCVDVYYNDAWWEGVIFDLEDGSAQRRIFFPDLGDEMAVGIDSLRITQDWNEITETWHCRGTWLFLELIEEHEQELYLAVSVKQIWYDLREKKGYEKLKDWTSSVRSLWKELVLEVIDDNVKIVIDHFLRVAGLPRSSEQEVQPVMEFNRSASNVREYPEIELASSLAIVSVENLGNSNERNLNFTSVQPVQEKCDQDKSVSISNDLGPNMNLLTVSDETCHEKSVPQVFLALPSNPGGNSGVSFNNRNDEQSSNNNSKLRKKGWIWLPAGPDIVPGAEFCPDAITKYAQIGKNDNIRNLVKKHLKHLKWEIQCTRDEKGVLRQRYISPDRKYYYSLRQVCLDLTETTVKILSPNSQDDRTILHTSPDYLDSSHPVQPEDDRDLDYRPEAAYSPRTESLVVKPEYNPQAAVDWCMLGVDENRKFKLKRTDMALKARQHLSALGWVFKYVIGSNSKRNLYHCSPEGKSYFSLRTACKACLDRVIGSESSASTCKTTENIILSDEAEDQLASGKQSCAVSNTDFNKNVIPSHALFKKLFTSSCMPHTRNLKRKRKTNSSCLDQIRFNSHGVGLQEFKLEDDLEDARHTYVLRSSKRVKRLDIPSSSNQSSQTVLSWLIDNNVVLPRAKVIYCSRKNWHPKAEGRITRQGIKCKCCGEVYTLCGFENHAGSTYCNPASRIFLEDGRSLLDCQLEVLKNGNVGNFIGEPHDRLKGNLLRGENDYKCSVCHSGGELILCDRCPSSFHKTCVGLEDVPDGDWFCPSCCCGICGNSNSREEVVDGGVLVCHQCELKYHRGCIQNGATDKFGSPAKENWFCSKKCEEIFFGLKKLLGKPILVGFPNLTWTLVKSSQHDTCKLDDTDIETLSKLNIAHRVMHECFEPVHEPYSSGDLVEDVLFSRGSMLNRLNFQGFYTVLLERNEELVSVATLRVFGETAAEIPLVGTRFQYRRLGMCRILMNELEKRLRELGVERLILPAIPSVLKTWTTSFGFSRMTTSERLQLIDYTFLNFLDTTMCQKFLLKRHSAELKLSRGSQPGLQNEVCESGYQNDLAGSSTVSEVSLAEQIEESMTVEQSLADVATKDTTGCESSVHPVVMENQPTCLEREPQRTKINPECSVVDTDLDKVRKSRGSDVTCYKRRKISAGGNKVFVPLTQTK